NDDNGSSLEAISLGSRNRSRSELLDSRPQATRSTGSMDRSVQSNAEVEGPDVFPVSLVVSIWEQIIEHAIDVESIVEHQRSDRGRDAQTGAHGVAQFERIDARWVGPQIPGVQEQ